MLYVFMIAYYTTTVNKEYRREIGDYEGTIFSFFRLIHFQLLAKNRKKSLAKITIILDIFMKKHLKSKF